MNDTITITKAQLQAALQAWEQDARDGKMLTPDESRAMPVEECAANSADHLWSLLGAA